MDLFTKLNETQCGAVKALSKNATADAILFFFAWRKRYSRVTDLDILKKDIEKEGFDININDYKNFFATMEQSKFGVLKQPKTTNSMGSFVWDYSLRTLGKVTYPSDSDLDKDKVSRILKSRLHMTEVPKLVENRFPPQRKIVSRFSTSKGGRPAGSRNKPKPASVILPGITPSQAKLLQELWTKWSK